MNLIFQIGILISALSFSQARTHDEIPKCSLTGVYKSRQTIVESPNYPNNYKPDTCWDYVIRSPYKCPTTFHIQFLDFYLEFSKDCRNDYLAIGLENIDDDMDVLCGQVVGIKKYRTPDGVLRLRFLSDESPWTTGKGFKLLITRLACENEELLRKLQDEEGDDGDDDTTVVTAPSGNFQPPEPEIMQIFRNLTGQDQYQIVTVPPVFGLNYPTQLPSPPYPAAGTVLLPSSDMQSSFLPYPVSDKKNSFPPPCTDANGQQIQLPNVLDYYGAVKGNSLTFNPTSVQLSVPDNYLLWNKLSQLQLQQQVANGGFSSPSRDQYIGSWSSTPSLLRAYDNKIDSLEACCVSAFQQKHFYLSSPGFPRTIFSNILPNMQKRDCVFRLQKSTSNVCRLRLDFKFFDFGQSYQGTGSSQGNIGLPAIENTQSICRQDYVQIDNQRFCGCRSGSTFSAYWPTADDKKLRMRMGYSDVPSGGFLLELVQEECSETQFAFMTTERPVVAALSTLNPNVINNQLNKPQQDQPISFEQQQNIYGDSYPAQIQQQHLQNINFGSIVGNNPYNTPTGQQSLNKPAGFPSYLLPPNPLLSQQQLQFLQNNNHHFPPSVGSSYLQQNYLPPQGLIATPFGFSQIRNARSYGDQQPLTVVETNSTRKEYYYYGDNDAAHYKEDPSHSSRSSSAETSSNWDRKDTNVKEQNESIGTAGYVRRKCTFDMGDILRLSVDILWITKPICYAPQRNWFTNWIG